MNGRTKFVVAGMVLMFLISWTMSLGRLFGNHFWNPQHAIKIITSADDDGNDDATTPPSRIEKIALSYYSHRRYVFFLPHVVGAVIWWNLYFLQLVPAIRHKYKWLHRNLGRLLMLVAVAQIWSGLGLACTSHSPIIKLVSLFLAIAVSYCLGQSLYYAIHRDIPKHKFWVLRLVGYVHTIVLQRFWLLTLILLRQFGWDSMLIASSPASSSPASLTETQVNSSANNDIISYDMFDQSFILSILTAWLITEWYLSAELVGMVEAPNNNKPVMEEKDAVVPVDPERRPLL